MINHMPLAIEQAKLGGKQGEIPVGAVIISQNRVVTRAFNLVETHKNPLDHAEILVIDKACRILQTTRLVHCDLYVTLEPCMMCAGAIAHARIRRVYFGAFNPKEGAIDHGVRFFSQPTCRHHPEIYGGIQEQDCQNLLRSFFVDKRRYPPSD
jgi:tRNA(adenine34) deaminase